MKANRAKIAHAFVMTIRMTRENAKLETWRCTALPRERNLGHCPVLQRVNVQLVFDLLSERFAPAAPGASKKKCFPFASVSSEGQQTSIADCRIASSYHKIGRNQPEMPCYPNLRRCLLQGSLVEHHGQWRSKNNSSKKVDSDTFRRRKETLMFALLLGFIVSLNS